MQERTSCSNSRHYQNQRCTEDKIYADAIVKSRKSIYAMHLSKFCKISLTSFHYCTILVLASLESSPLKKDLAL